MKINFNNRLFRPIQNTANEETSAETEFHYLQKENFVVETYNGSDIVLKNLIAVVDEKGALDMRY